MSRAREHRDIEFRVRIEQLLVESMGNEEQASILNLKLKSQERLDS